MTTGRLVWYEHLTTDPKAAIAFYTEVLGWTTQAFGADYTMFVGSQGPLGGVGKLPEAAQKMGAQPYWQVNVEVANVDAAVVQIEQLGGKVFVVESVPTVGRFAVIADPQGAVVAVFTPEQPMAPHDPQRAGEFSWSELYAADHVAAFEFYRQIAGWEQLSETPIGPWGNYLVFGVGSTELGGMMTVPRNAGPPPSWLHYVTMPDLDAACERAKARGAKVLFGPIETPGKQRVVALTDPLGGAFALITPKV
jgi:uncharacterized protein